MGYFDYKNYRALMREAVGRIEFMGHGAKIVVYVEQSGQFKKATLENVEGEIIMKQHAGKIEAVPNE